jgi:RimJ/RimL family protein N-acetyltransferase
VRAGREPPAGADPAALAGGGHPRAGGRDEPRVPLRWHVAETGRLGGTALPGGAEGRAGLAGERDAARWLASQDRGWRDGDRLSFAVLEAGDVGGCVLAGNVGLKNREETGRIGERESAEIGYWTAVAARGRGIAPAAVRAVTDWVFDAFAGASLRQIMLVHDVGNPASCRVAEKAGYPFRELSPANPPRWFTDGHIHLRLGG